MLFCFIWFDQIVKSWHSHCFYFIPTKTEQLTVALVQGCPTRGPHAAREVVLKWPTM